MTEIRGPVFPIRSFFSRFLLDFGRPLFLIPFGVHEMVIFACLVLSSVRVLYISQSFTPSSLDDNADLFHFGPSSSSFVNLCGQYTVVIKTFVDCLYKVKTMVIQ